MAINKKKITKIQVRRQQLKEITASAKFMHEDEKIKAEINGDIELLLKLKEFTVNKMIWTYIYKREVLKSFNNWRKLGYSVKKGAKSKLLWGQKIFAEKENKELNRIEEYEIYPVAFVFSEKDVVKHKTEKV